MGNGLMVFEMELQAFLLSAGIEQDEWDRSGADWGQLCLIARDFIEQKPALSSAAEQISSRIRTFPGVHSVRWRIKDTTHLLKKIVRKKLENPIQGKWDNISVENYLDVVTDLIGVRALHLFKDECVEIDSSICAVWDTCEPVVMYLRKGDEPIETIIQRGGEPKEHSAGYRSIHYIVRSQPEKKVLKAEIQVRTIFQEGWSEIDHRVRYPDYSDNEHVKFFLDMFNGLAGSADEMGSFVKKLTKLLSDSEDQKKQALDAVKGREEALAERDAAMIDIEERLNEFDQLKRQDAKSQEIIKKLKDDLSRLRNSQRAASIWGRPIEEIFPVLVSEAGSAKKEKDTFGKWNNSQDPDDLASFIANADFREILAKSSRKS
jgi:ppGpp synthetase/RelA/SpoT-type nucleotidyltranferase